MEKYEILKEIKEILTKNSLSLSSAESCTGGLVSSYLTDIDGSSKFIFQNFVTYSNEAKHRFLKVKNETLQKFGAVSKETAHQLGTPISSLNACSELFKLNYPDDALVSEMDKDIQRLQAIADRFSKIGSAPVLTSTNLMEVLTNTIDYMRTRTSEQVRYAIEWNGQPLAPDDPMPQVCVELNQTLMEWVIENLCKNAIDAMENKGKITLSVQDSDDKVLIDITDTGKGIQRKHIQQVFQPGYTTKTRGWGLGLSLAKRIIEQYHKGKIFVKQSVPNTGTTFRIVLHKKQ